MTAPDTAAPSASADRLGLVLLLLAALEIVCSYPNVLGLLSGDIIGAAGGTIVGLIELFGRPILAVAALVFALRRNARWTIITIAGLTFLVVVGSLPGVVRSGIYPVGSGIWGLHATVKLTVFPLLAFAATILAARNTRLGLATLLIALPMIAAIANAILFFFGVAPIY